jgi:hypothetical protein
MAQDGSRCFQSGFGQQLSVDSISKLTVTHNLGPHHRATIKLVTLPIVQYHSRSVNGENSPRKTKYLRVLSTKGQSKESK